MAHFTNFDDVVLLMVETVMIKGEPLEMPSTYMYCSHVALSEYLDVISL